MVPKKGTKNYKHPLIEAIVMSNEAVTSIDSDAVGLKKVASGKVREIFEVDKDKLLFVATDRISAFDVVLENVRGVAFSASDRHGAGRMLVDAPRSIPSFILRPRFLMQVLMRYRAFHVKATS